VIITSSFLQRGSQYTPRCHHHHPLIVAWSVGGEKTLQEDYYYPSPLGHVVEIQDVWVTNRVYLQFFLFNSLYVYGKILHSPASIDERGNGLFIAKEAGSRSGVSGGAISQEINK
jgi:hypothetical protein